MCLTEQHDLHDGSGWRRRKLWRGLALRAFVLATCCLRAESALAQTSTEPANPTAAATAEPARLTIDDIEALKKQAAESTEIDEETKKKIDGLLEQAADGVKRADELTALADQFKRETENLTERIDQQRSLLGELQDIEPSVGRWITPTVLEQEISKRKMELSELKSLQARSAAEPAARANRRRDIRNLLLSSSTRLAEVQSQLEAPAPADEPPMVTKARKAELQARRQMIEAELPAIQNELAKYDAEEASDFVRLERDVLARKAANAEEELRQYQQRLDEKRATAAADLVESAAKDVETAPLLLKPYAQANQELAEASLALTDPIEEARHKLESTKTRLEEVQKQFVATRQRVDDVGLTGSVGALLRRRRAALPDLPRRKQNVRNRQQAIEDAQYQLFDYNDARAESLESAVRQMLAGAPYGNEAERQEWEQRAGELFESRREFLNQVIRNYNTYLDVLFELDATEQSLIKQTEQYEQYTDERVLWIRSNRFLFSSLSLDASDAWIWDLDQWKQVGAQLWGDMRSQPGLYFIASLSILVLMSQKPRLRRELRAAGERAVRGSCAEFRPTMRAAMLTLVMSMIWPGTILFVAWRLHASSEGLPVSGAVANGLFMVCWVYFPLELLRRTCRKHGLADYHFDWPDSTIGVFRRNLRWATLIGLPLVYMTSALYSSDPEHGHDLVERLFFVALMVVLSAFLWRVIKPERGVFREYLAAHAGGWLDRLRIFWYWGGVLSPLALAVLTVAGSYYTAQQLTWRLYATFLFVLAVQYARALLSRLLLVNRRRISIEQAKQRRAAQVAAQEAAQESGNDQPAPSGPEQLVPVEEPQPDVAAHTEQSRRLVTTGLVAASLIGFWVIWVDVLPALRILDQWPVWTTTVTESSAAGGSAAALPGVMRPTDATANTAEAPRTREVVRNVTMADIALALLIGVVTIGCARNIPGLMEMSVLQRLPLDHSIRYAVTTITSYAIVLLGVILAFNAIAIGWSKVQWLATALTFGLAFGLQEIFANFVAGLILLFERPIRVGDVVTVDEISGVVSRIRIRATTITNWDRKEYVIPNKEFITGRVLNWTLSDKVNRIVINVGVAYGSDVDKAKGLLMKVCREHPLVLEDPPTRVTFEGFGDNTLNLVVRTYLPDLDNRLDVIDALHMAIDRAFREAQVEIAFPQRDLHLRSVDAKTLESLRRAISPPLVEPWKGQQAT